MHIWLCSVKVSGCKSLCSWLVSGKLGLPPEVVQEVSAVLEEVEAQRGGQPSDEAPLPPDPSQLLLLLSVHCQAQSSLVWWWSGPLETQETPVSLWLGLNVDCIGIGLLLNFPSHLILGEYLCA